MHRSTKRGREMPLKRLPLRDPRTVARDIPGVLDVLFPRLSGGLVAYLNKGMFSFEGVAAIPGSKIGETKLQKATLFELAVARAEKMLSGATQPDWEECRLTAISRQSRHYDAKLPEQLSIPDMEIASWASENLVKMLRSVEHKHADEELEARPYIPGMGWIASGVGDFAIGSTLIELKHTNKNFIAGDFRQILMYWILKYASLIGSDEPIWSDCVLLNPRRGAGLLVNFDYLVQSASDSSSRVEIYELMRSIVGDDLERRH